MIKQNKGSLTEIWLRELFCESDDMTALVRAMANNANLISSIKHLDLMRNFSKSNESCVELANIIETAAAL